MDSIIDIIMPAYNAEKIIDKTLKKLENQTFKKFRLIIINDGSNDKTKEKIEKIHRNIDILLINQTNKGEAGARNTGLKHLKSKYVLFLDCDDYLENDALEVLINGIKENELDLIAGGYKKVSWDEEIKKIIKYENQIITSKECLKKIATRNLAIGIGNSLIKSEIIILNKLKFKKFKYGTDNNFFREVIFYSKKIKIINKNIFYYRDNYLSLMNKTYNYQRKDSIKAVLETIEFLENKNMDKTIIEELNYFLNYEVEGCLVSLAKSKIKFRDLYTEFIDIKRYRKNIKLRKDLRIFRLKFMCFTPIIYLLILKIYFELKKIKEKLKK